MDTVLPLSNVYTIRAVFCEQLFLFGWVDEPQRRYDSFPTLVRNLFSKSSREYGAWISEPKWLHFSSRGNQSVIPAFGRWLIIENMQNGCIMDVIVTILLFCIKMLYWHRRKVHSPQLFHNWWMDGWKVVLAKENNVNEKNQEENWRKTPFQIEPNVLALPLNLRSFRSHDFVLLYFLCVAI